MTFRSTGAMGFVEGASNTVTRAEYEALKARAEKLAEALGDARFRLVDGYGNAVNSGLVVKIDKTLAEWKRGAE